MKEEKVDFKSLILLLKFSKRYIPGMVICVALILTSTVISLLAPELVSKLTDNLLDGIQNGINLKKLLDILVELSIMYVVVSVLSYSYSTLCDYIAQKTSYLFRREIVRKLTRLPLSFFDKAKRGEVLSRMTNDVNVVSDALTKNVSGLLSSFVLFFGVMYKMFATNVSLTLISIGLSILGSITMFVFAMFSQKYHMRTQQNLGEMNGMIEEVYNNHKIVRIFNTRKAANRSFNVINEQLYRSHWKSSALSIITEPIVSIVDGLSSTIIMIMGCSMFLQDNPIITFGELTAFLIYSEMFSSPLSTLGGSLSSLVKTAAAATRVFGLLNETEQEKEKDKPKKVYNVKGNITFDGVWFEYIKDKPIIKNLNLNINAGEKIAIVGPSGVGKTTLVNLLMRFYEVQKGEIRIDGEPITKYTRKAIRSLFYMVLQDTWLFEGTIRDNLTLGRKNITDDDIKSVCDSVGISHLIETLPDGYDTELNELTGLSEGQRQQLTVARMMLKEAPFMIFDEATSALDSGTEMKIQKVLQTLMDGKTCLIIAHRLSTIRNADRIIVMNDGTVAESGTHDELMAKNGIYRSMYDNQIYGTFETE